MGRRAAYWQAQAGANYAIARYYHGAGMWGLAREAQATAREQAFRARALLDAAHGDFATVDEGYHAAIQAQCEFRFDPEYVTAAF